MSDNQSQNGPDEKKSEPTLNDRVDEALKNVDDNGKLVFADDVDPVFKELVKAKKIARDNQSAFTKGQMELAKTKAAKEALEKQITSASPTLTPEQVSELDDLKYSDPDTWRTKLNQYENEARAKAKEALEEITETASTTAAADLTLKQRQEAIDSFSSDTGIELTKDILENDVPPRLQAKMKDMPFNEYLSEVAAYLGKTKVVKDEQVAKTTNIGKLPGSEEVRQPKKAEYVIL